MTNPHNLKAGHRHGCNQAVWREGRDYFARRLRPGERDRAIFCVSHYLFYGDGERHIPALGYQAEAERAAVMQSWFEDAAASQDRFRRNQYIDDIRRACFWVSRSKEPGTAVTAERPAARPASSDRFRFANLARQNQARRKVLDAFAALRAERPGYISKVEISRASGVSQAVVAKIVEQQKLHLFASSNGGAINTEPREPKRRPSEITAQKDLLDQEQKATALHWYRVKQQARRDARRRIYALHKHEANLTNQNPHAQQARMYDVDDTREVMMVAKQDIGKAQAKRRIDRAARLEAEEQQAERSHVALGELANVEATVLLNSAEDRPQVYRHPDQLKPYARNPRRHSPESIDKLAAMIRELGWTNPCCLIDENDNVLAGHGRRMAAQKLGYTSVPCRVITGLTETQKQLVILWDNRSQELSDWDNELLSINLQDLELQGVDLLTLGWSENELGKLMQPLASTGLTDDDALPAVPEQPVSKPGDIWICGDHRVGCVDSRQLDQLESLMGGQKADLILSDPPYGVSFEQGKYCATAGKNFRGVKIANDELKGEALRGFLQEVFANASLVSKQCAVYCFAPPLLEGNAVAQALVDAGIRLQSKIIWRKSSFVLGRCDYHWSHEELWYGFTGDQHAWYGGRDKGTVWDVAKIAKVELHPTQKPVELAEIALQNSSKGGDIVLDPFAGSGFVLIAAEKHQRRAFCADVEPRFVDTMVKRWEAFTGQQAVLEGTTAP